jgi:hypothetical protein
MTNGAVYVGEWSVDNRQRGYGLLYFEDGGLFEGFWVDGHV